MFGTDAIPASQYSSIGQQLISAYLSAANNFTQFPYKGMLYPDFLKMAQAQTSATDLENYVGSLYAGQYLNNNIHSVSEAIQNIQSYLSSSKGSATYILGALSTAMVPSVSTYGSPIISTTPMWNGQPVPNWSPAYSPSLPLVQYQGTDPSSGQINIYQVDQNGYLWKRFNASSGSWDSSTLGEFSRPANLTPLFGAQEQAQAADALTTNGVITEVTPYLIVGDEPDISLQNAIDLSTMLKPDDLTAIKSIFSQLPRAVLWQWFKDNVQNALPNGYTVDKKGVPTMTYGPGGIPLYSIRQNIYGETPTTRKLMQDETWSAFINLFNESNVEAIKVQMPFAPLSSQTFWDWEAKKVEAFNAQVTSDEMKTLDTTMDSYIEAATPVDPEASYLMQQYALLPKIGDLGLEISRQNAIKELLKQKEYKAVEGIIDAYKYLHTTMLSDAVTSPIPFDIVSSDGSLVQKTTTPTSATT